MKASRKWLDGYIESPLVYLNQRRWEAGAPAEDCYTDEALAVFSSYSSKTEAEGWPIAETSPFSRDRASAIADFLTISTKPGWVDGYFSWLAKNLPAKLGYGFDWAIRKDTFLRAKEGNFASLKGERQ